MTRHEEQTLVELAAAGDRAAAARLIATHQRPLYAYLLRISGRPDVAEDIVQDAFVRVLSNLDRFDPRFRFSTWLFTIAKRLYVNAMQKHRPKYDSDVVDNWRGDSAEPCHTAERTETGNRAKDAITRALMGLTDEQREVIVLFHQQEWAITQISEFMGMPEGTVKSHLHRGRRRMRELFEREQQRGRGEQMSAMEALI